jgi:hypothetical protein
MRVALQLRGTTRIMSPPAVSLDDAGYQDLRIVADRLLETTRVEYVDEGVLLVMNPPGIEDRPRHSR